VCGYRVEDAAHAFQAKIGLSFNLICSHLLHSNVSLLEGLFHSKGGAHKERHWEGQA